MRLNDNFKFLLGWTKEIVNVVNLWQMTMLVNNVNVNLWQVTMLVNNYRSHAAILRLPSELFYFGELKERASHDLTHTFVNWHLLPQPGVPLIFHGVRVSLQLLSCLSISLPQTRLPVSFRLFFCTFSFQHFSWNLKLFIPQIHHGIQAGKIFIIYDLPVSSTLAFFLPLLLLFLWKLSRGKRLPLLTHDFLGGCLCSGRGCEGRGQPLLVQPRWDSAGCEVSPGSPWQQPSTLSGPHRHHYSIQETGETGSEWII